MTLQNQVRFWLIGLAVTAFSLWLLSPVMLPFVAGFALAYLLDPVADWLERRGMPRVIASLLILGVFLLLFVGAIVALVPALLTQIEGFVARLPEYSARLRELATSWSDGWLGQLIRDRSQEIESNIGGFATTVAEWLGGLLQSILTGGMAIVNVLALFVVTPVVAFYMLVDWDRMVERIDGLLPRDHQQTIRRLASEVDGALAGFVRGQSTVCVLLGLFYAIGLSLLGLNFALLIGLAAGLISFIPYIGSISGFIVAVGVALVQFWPDWTMVAAVAAVFFAGQALEGNILQPKLVGGHVGLHPVTLMFALFAFGYLFGFVGMLIAVPIAAAIGVLVRFARDRYIDSPLYAGAGGNRADQGQDRQPRG
jgi:predicted PurR-regulated permease PerM